MLDKDILVFLNELKENNYREWFHANKSRYESASRNFDAFVNRLIPEVAKIDPNLLGLTAKDCTFRIYKDVRFSKDKSPYKTNMGAYISRGGRKGGFAGYYLHIDVDGSFLAGGIHQPLPEVLKAVRTEIYEYFDEFKTIINQPDFLRLFGEVASEQRLQTAPKGFDKNFEGIEILKNKEFNMLHFFENDLLFSEQFFAHTIRVFEAMKPFNDFMNRVIEQVGK